MILTLVGVTLANTFVAYYDKKGASSNLSRLQYIFLKIVAIIPFALLLFAFYEFQLEINLASILLMLAVIVVNLTNYLGFLGVIKSTSPYETGIYASLTMPLVYAIDILIGAEQFSYLNLGYLALVFAGIFILSRGTTKSVGFRKSLVLSIISSVSKGYLLYFLLQYVSIPIYIIVLHVVTAVIIFSFLNKQLNTKTLTKENYKWAFTNQSVGTVSLALNAVLAQASVSLYVLRVPLKLIFTTVTAFFIKSEQFGNKPTKLKLIGSIITIIGITFFVIN
jgi:hypothetical protein